VSCKGVKDIAAATCCEWVSLSVVPKALFLVAMARSFVQEDRTWFDGKIWCWEITERLPAQRNSVNRL
jgi:hypothetical protein